MAQTKQDKALEQYADARRKTNAELVREKIQTTALVELLNKYALGTSKAKLTGTRLKAIEMLLDKSLPDLASLKHEVEAQNVVFLIDTEFKKEEPDQEITDEEDADQGAK